MRDKQGDEGAYDYQEDFSTAGDALHMAALLLRFLITSLVSDAGNVVVCQGGWHGRTLMGTIVRTKKSCGRCVEWRCSS